MQNTYEQVQAEKLKRIVAYAFENFSYYRKKISQVGLKPTDIQSLGDLDKLPLTVKEELKEKFDFDEIFYRLAGKLYYIGFTTGTVSIPMPVYYTHDDFERWEKNLAKGLSMAGITNKDVAQITFGRCGIACIVLLGAIRRTGATGIPIDADSGTASELLKRMEKFHVSFLLTFPSIVREFCRIVESERVKGPCYLRKIFLMGESWSETFRRRVEDTLNVEVYDIYGSTEVGMVGVECSAHEGLHLLPDQVLVEILDPNTGKPVSRQEEGEIVVTTFWKEALPLIRYRTGDIASKIEGSCCCGLDLPRISRIIGRVSDLIFIGSTKIHPIAVEAAIIDTCNSALNYQIVLSQERGKDKIKLVLEAPEDVMEKQNLKVALSERISNLNEDLASLIKANLVFPPEVEFVPLNSLTRKGGKIAKILDLRKSEPR
jgi:phenylacetate-CoA ligase